MKTQLAITSVLASLLATVCLADGQVPVSLVETYNLLRSSAEKAECKGETPDFENGNTLIVSVPSKNFKVDFISSAETPACEKEVDENGVSTVTCSSAIREDRYGIPADHREMPTGCSNKTLQITRNPVTNTTEIFLIAQSWNAWYGAGCEESLSQAKIDHKETVSPVFACGVKN